MGDRRDPGGHRLARAVVPAVALAARGARLRSAPDARDTCALRMGAGDRRSGDLLSMGELELIAAVQAALRPLPPRVLTGPGDDAAVVRADAVAVTSIDTVVEDVHFELATHSPADVGHKALATAPSDIAAMGAGPGAAHVSLALPEGFGQDAALELVEAMRLLAERQGVAIAGGDVVSGPALAGTGSVTGWSGAADRLVYRSGARPGDVVGVTGELGGSGAGLLALRAGDSEDPHVER